MLADLKSMNEFYLDDEVDRMQIMEMKTRFRNADTKTKEFFVNSIYNDTK